MSKVQPHSLMALYDELEELGKRNYPTPDQRARMEEIGREIRYLENLSVPESQPPSWMERSGSIKRSFSSVHSAGYRTVPDTEQGLFAAFIRTGDEGIRSELRASNATSMNIGTAADGGDLVPTGHYNEIQARLRPQALWNQLGVRVIPGIGTTVNVPIDNESDDGAWVSTGESSEFDLDAPAVSKVTMTLTKYTKKITITEELLHDEDSGLLEFLNQYVADGLAALYNNLLVTEALASATAALTLDSPTTIDDTEIPELVYKLKAEYAHNPNVTWLMNRSTEGYIRSIASDSQFLFAPTPAGRPGSRSELWGLPVVTSSYMPAMGAGNKSLIVGDWSRMGVRFAPQMQFLRDPYTRGGYGEVNLYYFTRVVFKLFQPEALAMASHPTA